MYSKNKYIQGFSLPATLVIMLIVVGLIFSVYFSFFFWNKFAIRNLQREQLSLDCYSAAQEILANGFSQQTIESLGETNQVTITKKKWGLFNTYTICAKGIHDSVSSMFITASKCENLFEPALTISKENFRGSLTGNNYINGDIKVTRNRFSWGQIGKVRTVKKEYLIGQIVIDKNIKPKLINNLVIEGIKNDILLGDKLKFSGKQYLSELKSSAGFEKQKLRKFELNSELVIDESFDANYSKIFCKGDVVVKEGSKIENALIFTPGKINVEDNCILINSQLFSETEIKIKKSIANYPSILCLYIDSADKSKIKAGIELENTTFNGSLLLVESDSLDISNQHSISIDKESIVQGLVYSEKYAGLEGKVYGTVYCRGLRNKIPPTIYINWLIDLLIDKSQMDDNFLFPAVFEGRTEIVDEIEL